jgi:hypothetical protein
MMSILNALKIGVLVQKLFLWNTTQERDDNVSLSPYGVRKAG